MEAREAVTEDTLLKLLPRSVSPVVGRIGGSVFRVWRNPVRAGTVQVAGSLVPSAYFPPGKLRTGSVFAQRPGAPTGTAALECENDARGHFTLWPSGDSQGGRRASAAPARFCGHAARPPVAGRATRAVAGATPLAEGSVRRSGECVFTTRPPPSGLLPYQRSLAGRPSSPRSEALRCPTAEPVAAGNAMGTQNEMRQPLWKSTMFVPLDASASADAPSGRCRTRALGSDLGTSPVSAGRSRRTPSRKGLLVR